MVPSTGLRSHTTRRRTDEARSVPGGAGGGAGAGPAGRRRRGEEEQAAGGVPGPLQRQGPRRLAGGHTDRQAAEDEGRGAGEGAEGGQRQGAAALDGR